MATSRQDQGQTNGGWSIHIATVSGIPIRIHFTFFLLLGWLYISREGLLSVLFILGLFTCVVLHELGHSITAQRYGIGVAEIVLYPIGGVARMERLPAPAQELWIALAGPAVNVVIATALYIGLSLTHHLQLTAQYQFGTNFLQDLLVANVWLCLFNMIPAFPMDGGRVLRALLGLRLGELRATEIAATIGQFLAIVLGFVGLVYLHNPFMLFIAFFVFLGAGQEAQMYRGKALVEGLPVKAAMITDFRTLPVGASLGDASQLLLQTSQQDFPVVHGDDVVGVLSRQNLLRGLAEHGTSGYVAGSMTRDYLTVPPDGDLQEIASEMQAGTHPCVLVMSDGHLLGFVTLENLAELLIVRQLTQENQSAAGIRPA